MLRRQKRFDRQLEEGTLKDSTTGQPVTQQLSSPTYFEHLWEDYKQAWYKLSTERTESLL
jgi:hypothetical protein